MTKKHFEAVASALLASKPEKCDCFASLAELDQWKKTVRGIASSLDLVCPNINVPRFLKACGYTE